jgi:hypothetical protein
MSHRGTAEHLQLVAMTLMDDVLASTSRVHWRGHSLRDMDWLTALTAADGELQSTSNEPSSKSSLLAVPWKIRVVRRDDVDRVCVKTPVAEHVAVQICDLYDPPCRLTITADSVAWKADKVPRAVASSFFVVTKDEARRKLASWRTEFPVTSAFVDDYGGIAWECMYTGGRIPISCEMHAKNVTFELV